MTQSDRLHFELCVRENMLSEHTAGERIGTYNEKRLHRVLKKFFENDEACHKFAGMENVTQCIFHCSFLLPQSTWAALTRGSMKP